MLGHHRESREATPMWWRRRYKRSDPGSDLRPVPARSGEGLDEGVAGAGSGGGVGSETPRMEGVGGRGMGHGAWGMGLGWREKVWVPRKATNAQSGAGCTRGHLQGAPWPSAGLVPGHPAGWGRGVRPAGAPGAPGSQMLSI